jgi:hypothetical protein
MFLWVWAPWRWQYVSPKRLHLPASLHGAKTQKIITILTAVKTSTFTYEKIIYSLSSRSLIWLHWWLKWVKHRLCSKSGKDSVFMEQEEFVVVIAWNLDPRISGLKVDRTPAKSNARLRSILWTLSIVSTFCNHNVSRDGSSIVIRWT